MSLPYQNHEWLGASMTQGREEEKRCTYSLRSLQHTPDSRGERPSDFPCAVGEVSLMLKPRLSSLFFGGGWQAGRCTSRVKGTWRSSGQVEMARRGDRLCDRNRASLDPTMVCSWEGGRGRERETSGSGRERGTGNGERWDATSQINVRVSRRNTEEERGG